MAEDAFPISGSIDPKAFPFLLMDLHRHGATGSLKVDGPAYQKALYFRGGRVLFGSSNDPKDQLGSILIESGRISPEQLEDVNTKVGPGSPLAKVLAESGFVSQRELSEAARAKVERILSDVLSYESGSFEFEDGVLPKGAVDLKLSTDKLVLAAVRRVGDRAFVLRHIGGLDAMLSLTGDAERRLADVQAETGRLPEQLDGRRTLKDAAAAARVDEFEAAKVACGLLFLGLAHRAGEAAPQESAFALLEGDDLDLGSTARFALSPESTRAPAAPELDPLTFAPPPEIAALPEALTLTTPRRFEPETIFIEPSTQEATVIGEPTEAPTMARPMARPPLVPPPPRPTPADTKPPTPVREIRLPSMVEGGMEAAEEPTAKPAPPSREDLAALDALLNSRGIEGPMTPLEKPKEERWEPRFGQSTPQARNNRSGGGRSIASMVGLLIVCLGLGGVVWFQFFRGQPGTPVGAVPKITPTASSTLAPATTLVAANETAEPAATPTSPATTPASPLSTAQTTTTLPSVTPRPAAPSPQTRRPGGGSLADARNALEKGDFPEAAHFFASSLKSVGPGSYTVQLLVACADETLAKASQNVSAQEFFIVPVEYKGRSCYRVCWGVYDSEARAHAAVRAIPEYFRKGGASPKAMSTASILP